MLGLLFIYFIGKYFYCLAREFNKNKWVFAILGIVSYYAGAIIMGFVIGFISIYLDDISWMEDQWWINMLSLPVGIFSTWLLYKFLKNPWEKELKDSELTLADFSEDAK